MIAKMTIYTTSLDHLVATREVRHQVFGPLGRYPASTFLVISGLAKPEYLVEFEATALAKDAAPNRSEEHTSELQSLMRITYAVSRMKIQKNTQTILSPTH